MTTTTIRIDDALKARVAEAAERSGKTSHAFIMDAIRETVEQAERRADFHRVSDERWEEVVRTGKTIPLAEIEAYVEARLDGKTPPPPVARRSVAIANALAAERATGAKRSAKPARKKAARA
jgi:predicted transcriptional regulator